MSFVRKRVANSRVLTHQFAKRASPIETTCPTYLVAAPILLIWHSSCPGQCHEFSSSGANGERLAAPRSPRTLRENCSLVSHLVVAQSIFRDQPDPDRVRSSHLRVHVY